MSFGVTLVKAELAFLIVSNTLLVLVRREAIARLDIGELRDYSARDSHIRHSEA
jgi:hypothetical protein